MSPSDLQLIKKYEGHAAVPVAIEEVAEIEMCMPIVRTKKDPSSLISPDSVGIMDRKKKTTSKIISAKKYNYSTLNNY